MGRRRTWTDEDLTTAVEVADNLFQVCQLLDIKPGARTYELLRRHMDRLGLDRARFPKAERAQPRRRGGWTDDDLPGVVARCRSLTMVLKELGYKPSGGMHRFVKQKIMNLGIDTSHFVGQGWSKGLYNNHTRIPLDEILVKNSTYTSTGGLRRRLIAEGLKEARCECCGLNTWLGQPLPLTLDHVNGDHTDNRIENLRILCPNCHALTPTWCGRNRPRAA
jgi:hypothetical protein